LQPIKTIGKSTGINTDKLKRDRFVQGLQAVAGKGATVQSDWAR